VDHGDYRSGERGKPIKSLVEGQYKVEHADVIHIGSITKDADGKLVPLKIYPVGWTQWEADF
jgi:hypothetical protein